MSDPPGPAADPKALISDAAKTSKDSGSYKFEWKMEDNSATEHSLAERHHQHGFIIAIDGKAEQLCIRRQLH